MTRRDPASPTLTRKRRCAVYTRKSTDEGLEKEFNSLDAQREACEAYIASQRSEGWVLVHDRYDDGGVSGGTLERPALKRLLADIEAGLVDVVVVYKIDRLSRSLMDFAKLVQIFDQNEVTFDIAIGRCAKLEQSQRRIIPRLTNQGCAGGDDGLRHATNANGVMPGDGPPMRLIGGQAAGTEINIAEKHRRDIEHLPQRHRLRAALQFQAAFLTARALKQHRLQWRCHTLRHIAERQPGTEISAALDAPQNAGEWQAGRHKASAEITRAPIEHGQAQQPHGPTIGHTIARQIGGEIVSIGQRDFRDSQRHPATDRQRIRGRLADLDILQDARFIKCQRRRIARRRDKASRGKPQRRDALRCQKRSGQKRRRQHAMRIKPDHDKGFQYCAASSQIYWPPLAGIDVGATQAAVSSRRQDGKGCGVIKASRSAS